MIEALDEGDPACSSRSYWWEVARKHQLKKEEAVGTRMWPVPVAKVHAVARQVATECADGNNWKEDEDDEGGLNRRFAALFEAVFEAVLDALTYYQIQIHEKTAEEEKSEV